tara:strand:+ start:10317 stop:10463 length:147 start_codon:yes stop_codon:yes gene_type:complete
MAMKTYSVTLLENEVERARQLYKKYGSKLSPLLGELLKKWSDEEEGKR